MSLTARRSPVAFLLIALSAFSASSPCANAQPTNEFPILRINEPVTRTLTGGEAHTFRLDAPARHLIKVTVLQKGVDVSVQAFDAQQKRLVIVDDSLGRVGAQEIEFEAETAGDYFVRVTARAEEVGGSYEIVLVLARAVTRDDRIRVTARGHISTGNSLRSRPSPDRNRKALAEYEKARQLYHQLNDVSGQAMALQYTGRVYETQSDYVRARQFYLRALEFWQRLHDRRGEALALKSIGSMNVFLGDFNAALPLLHKSAEIHRGTGDKEGEALAYHETANIHFQKGDFATALEQFERAEKLYRALGSKNLLGYLLSNIGEAYRGIGQLKTAADYQNQALAIFRALNRPHGIATALVYLGLVYSELGEARRAISYYEPAAPLCASLEERDCEARAYNFLGAAYAKLAEPQKALDYYAKSAAIYRQRGQTIGLIRMLNSSGALYVTLGEGARAREFFKEALGLARKSQNKLEEATALRHLGELFQTEGDTRSARLHLEQALSLQRETRNPLAEAATLARLGLLANSEGRTPEAMAIFEIALVIHRNAGAKPDQALTLHNLALAHYEFEDFTKALDYFDQALRLFRETENRNGEAMTLHRLAMVQRKTGRTEDARKNITTALAIAETIRGKLGSTDLRSTYLATVQQYYELYIDLLMEEHRAHPGKDFAVRALEASEQARARSLLDLLHEAKADLRRDADPQLLAREKELTELINGKSDQQQTAFSDPKKAELAKVLGQELNGLTLELETLQARIRESNPRYAELVSASSDPIAETQKLLEADTVLLEYKLSDERSYVWLITANGLQSHELAGRAEIEKLAQQFYQSLTARNQLVKPESPGQRRARVETADKQLETLGEKLRGLLLGPIESSLAGKRVLIVADGALQYVPFAALLNEPRLAGRSGAREIAFLPSIGVLSQLRRAHSGRPTPTKTVAVFADPVFEADDPRLPPSRRTTSNGTQTEIGFYGNGLPRLLGAREEARFILALAPAGTTFSAFDFDANRDRVTKGELNQYRVLHFATHALVNSQQPQLSGIVLSMYDALGNRRDGFLRLNHIYDLRLSSELVVLSACSTALGKDVRGEGLIGLTRGFMYAGAPRVIASLWKVDDEATTELMKLFYRNLLQKQMPASAALSAAQAEMRAQPRWRSPYYWAAFTLQGDWR
ncbi:MAG TPA: CHAT domain-containing protein [Pyrinomonadaceae bacterium]|nr:CHAT domain-containing protein [Pyrinomonadaceae bacterium]